VPRVVVLGCGTGVGKTRVSVALVRELNRRRIPALGLKPIESGVIRGAENPIPNSDAAALAAVSAAAIGMAHPLYALRNAVSPHLAARTEGVEIDLVAVRDWVGAAEAEFALRIAPHRAHWTVLETAGGVFSPLGPGLSNFDLARVVSPARWILVAADALGVLHDLSATLQALAARNQHVDHVVLSAAREPDASTGSNARELAELRIVTPSAVLARNDDQGVSSLVDALLGRDES